MQNIKRRVYHTQHNIPGPLMATDFMLSISVYVFRFAFINLLNSYQIVILSFFLFLFYRGRCGDT